MAPVIVFAGKKFLDDINNVFKEISRQGLFGLRGKSQESDLGNAQNEEVKHGKRRIKK